MKPKSLPSRLFNRNSAAAPGQTLNLGSACKYRRHMDFVDPTESVENSACDGSHAVADDGRQKEKCHREVHFAFLPERYEPLVDDEARGIAKEEEKTRKKEKYKKVKKFQCRMLAKHCAPPGSV
ncbi:uncharacterized protein C1orf115 isoform X3 [Scophthalmus maximus]|nr:uncharacterized protein C1orf115 isoform X3 [Scophthalmus maximus]